MRIGQSGLLFLIFFFFFISWRLITLQYCSGFCHTLTWISHGFTCVPQPDSSSLLSSSDSHCFEAVFAIPGKVKVKLFSRVWLFASCSPPGSSIHGILQERTLEWVAISFSRGPSRPRDRTRVSRIVGRHFTVWATREVLGISGRVLLNIMKYIWWHSRYSKGCKL